MPTVLNEELNYKNEKFNYRSDFEIITEHINDFLNVKKSKKRRD